MENIDLYETGFKGKDLLNLIGLTLFSMGFCSGIVLAARDNLVGTLIACSLMALGSIFIAIAIIKY